MTIAQIILSVLTTALTLYLLALWLRIGLDLVLAFSRSWRPRGVMLVIAESTYTITDPPVRLLRRALPPLRIGALALDFSVAIIMLAVILLMTILGAMLG